MTDLVHLMLRCLVALWIAAGFADWLCHRRSNIEATTGLRESAFHWGQLVLVGTGMVLALFFRPTHMLLAALIALWIAHQGLTWIELRFVVGRRHISPLEQMVHSFLEILPLAAIALIAVLAADSAATQTQGGLLLALERASEHPGFFVCAGVGAIGLVIIPYVEESLRCARGARDR